MKIRPISQIEAPAYPSAIAAAADVLLSKHVPLRWHRAKGLAGAVTVALATNFAGGCGSSASDNAASNPPPQPSPLVAEASDWTRSIYGSRPQSFIMGSIVRPLPAATEEAIRAISSRPESRAILLKGVRSVSNEAQGPIVVEDDHESPRITTFQDHSSDSVPQGSP
jgi:hypothetical protein